MAMIDYGCRFKTNGKLYDFKGRLFMDAPYWVPPLARVKEDGDIRIKNDYFAYCGDSRFLLCFYKTWFVVVDDCAAIKIHSQNCQHETLFFGDVHIDVERIPKKKYPNDLMMSWMDDDLDPHNKKGRMHRLRRLKHIVRYKDAFAYYPRRFRATWDYDGNHYDVIYGYGIDDLDVMENCFNNGNGYDMTEEEINFYRNWFREENK